MVTKQAGDRGVSTVLGVILVIGMVIAASIVVLSVGAITLGDAQSAITTESAVTQMEELNSKILEAVEEPGGKVSMAVATPGSGSLEIETSGWVNLTVENSTGANVTTGAMTLGRVTYTVNDQEIVIQSGGVWRSNTGSDGAALVSRPTIGYNFDRKNPTLDLSVVDISGIEREGDRISFVRNGKPTEKLRSINPIEPGSHLHITVKSELYRTWGDYFENRLEGKVNYDHEDNTVTAKVPAMPEPVTLDSGVVAAGNLSIWSNASGVDGDVSLGGTTDDEGRVFGIVTENETGNEQIKPAASKVHGAYARLEGESKPVDSDDITAGEYFVEDDNDLFTGGSGPTFNTSDGDIQLFVDGELKSNNNITVVGDNDVQLYVNGTVHMKGQAKWGDESHIDEFTVYSHDVDRLTGFYGTLYTDAISVAGTGARAGLVGALVTTADTVQMTGNMEITYDDSLEDETLIEVEIERGGPARIKYIQIKHTALT